MVKRVLPDTNIWSYWLRGQDFLLQSRMERAFDSLLLSSVVYSELCYGATKSSNPMHLRKIHSLGEMIPIVDYLKADAFIYGEVRSDLEGRGEIIGPYDLQIASQALRLSALLVTHNQNEFARVSGLRTEDWVSVI